VDLIKPNQNITYKVGATNFELQRAIEAALPAAMAQTKDLAKNFKGSTEKETCSKIFNFLMSNIQYKVDGDNQKIKLPSAFLREKIGDCKSYSLFTGAILGNLKIPFNFTYASYNPKDKTPEHIYVTTKKGCIIDAVYGKFNAEKKPSYKYQKSMNISYISGIKNRSENYSKRDNNYNNIGNVFSKSNATICGFQGLGRTGLDWAKAVGQNITLAQANMYFGKNVALAPARGLINMFIRNNGGGIANFLYSMWLRDTPYYLPNQKKYDEEYNRRVKPIDIQFPLTPFVMTAAEKNVYDNLVKASLKGNNFIQAFKAASIEFRKTLKGQRLVEYDNVTSNINSNNSEKSKLATELNKKYPSSTRFLPSATDSSKAKYRAIELKWFYDLGGSPDDLNEAVKEGNTKSPRGKDANYMLNKAFNGGLSFGDLPLVIRAFVSAQAGDKFGLGDDGTYLLGINGTRTIGAEPVTTVTTAATITAYSTAIIPILVFVMSEWRKWRSEETVSEIPTTNPIPAGGGGMTDLFSDNTGILLLAAAGVGVYLYTK
jgi:hypothetical protein